MVDSYNGTVFKNESEGQALNICVYGAGSETIDELYRKTAFELGFKIAQKGHGIVFGGGKVGLMGSVARGCLSGGGSAIGIAPEFFRPTGVLLDSCTELIITPDMRSRKENMEKSSDAFIVLPGGIGTFDEFFEILTLRKLERHRKPIVLFNIDGYYDALLDYMKLSAEKKFMSDEVFSLFGVFDDPDDILGYIENNI